IRAAEVNRAGIGAGEVAPLVQGDDGESEPFPRGDAVGSEETELSRVPGLKSADVVVSERLPQRAALVGGAANRRGAPMNGGAIDEQGMGSCGAAVILQRTQPGIERRVCGPCLIRGHPA